MLARGIRLELGEPLGSTAHSRLAPVSHGNSGFQEFFGSDALDILAPECVELLELWDWSFPLILGFFGDSSLLGSQGLFWNGIQLVLNFGKVIFWLWRFG